MCFFAGGIFASIFLQQYKLQKIMKMKTLIYNLALFLNKKDKIRV